MEPLNYPFGRGRYWDRTGSALLRQHFTEFGAALDGRLIWGMLTPDEVVSPRSPRGQVTAWPYRCGSTRGVSPVTGKWHARRSSDARARIMPGLMLNLERAARLRVGRYYIRVGRYYIAVGRVVMVVAPTMWRTSIGTAFGGGDLPSARRFSCVSLACVVGTSMSASTGRCLSVGDGAGGGERRSVYRRW